MSTRPRNFLTVLAALAVLTGAGFAAGAQANKSKLDKADQAAAKASLLKLGDLPSPFTWKGGKVTSGTGAQSLSCKSFHPKVSDLVTTGDAAATFTAQGVQLQNQAELLQTAKMVELDFKRTFVPKIVPCLESSLEGGVAGLKVLKAGQITFPHDAQYTVAYRVLFAVTPKGGKPDEGAFDFVVLGGGRKELTLAFTALFGTAASEKSGLGGMNVIEQDLAGIVTRRALGSGKIA